MKILVTIVATVGLMGLGVAGASAKDAYCDQWAKDQAFNQTKGNILGGAAVGGVGGAVLGGILGKKKKGVGTGAAIGALAGGGLGAASRNRAYNQYYADCVANKASYQPAPAPAYAPAVGSPQWVAACDAKYKTFNPATGYFIAKYDGAGNPVYRVCSLP